MIYNNTLSGLQLDTLEVCINLNKVSVQPRSMFVNIPKLMPFINIGSPNTGKMSISGNMFINDSGCAMSAPSLISTQNYITIKPHPNRGVYFPDKPHDSSYMILTGQKFLCEVVQGDIRNIYLTDKL